MRDSLAAAASRRALDIAASSCALVVLAPVLGMIAIRVKRDSPGPVLFRQQRVGRYGHPFTIYKFRTMRTDAGDGPLVTAARDSRVTAVGARLRRSKLDELPQFLNVLKGDMSLVGPRPEVPAYVSMWSSETRRVILSVRPGLTDPTTLALRDEESILAATNDPITYYENVLLPAKSKRYADYVRSRTVPSDLVTLAKTAFTLAPDR